MRKAIFLRLGPRLTGKLIAIVTAIAICIVGYQFLLNAQKQKYSHLSESAGDDGDSSEDRTDSDSTVEKDNTDPQNPQIVFDHSKAETIGNQISSKAALLCNNKKNTVICSKSIDTPIPAIAVLSLAVALTVSDAANSGEIAPSDRAVCPASAAALPCYPDGSSVLSIGGSLSVAELVRCMFCTSPELFAYTLAIHLSGSEQAFVTRMNALLNSIGATKTVFLSVSNSSAESTTAYDAAIIFKAATETEAVLGMISSKTTFSVSANGNAWNTVTLCNKFYSECCTEGQAKADGIVCGYYFVYQGKQYTYVLFDRADTTLSAISLSSDTGYADSLIMLSRAMSHRTVD